MSVRYRLPRPVPPGAPGLTDVVGDLVAYDGLGMTVRNRRDELVHVPTDALVASKVVPAARR